MRGMSDHLTFGERVRFYRKRRKLTQSELGQLLNRSENWVYRVETDRLSVNSVKQLTSIAEALRVHVEDLQGSPTLLEDQDGHRASVPVIRAALMQSRRLSGSLFDNREVPRLERMSAQVGQAWELYQASEYANLGSKLPDLLADSRLAVHTFSAGPQKDEALRGFALTLHLAAVYLRKLGETNLAWKAVDEGDVAADELGDPAVVMTLRRGVAHVQLGAGLPEDAVRVTLTAPGEVPSGWWTSSPLALSVYGTLFLNGAVAAARIEDQADQSLTNEMLAKAQDAADRLGSDRNEMWTSFGPANVKIHRLATALEFEDIGSAVAIASDMRGVGPGLPVERQARLRLDIARAFGEAGRTDDAVDNLKRAFQKAPEQIRAHEFARDLAKRLRKRSQRRDMQELAVRLGAVK
ncbi:XRE family transcriptional regulator [Streptomyces klenkii]|uniref:XRE family transcriptional regulator n=2 Tax=Streptomyces klenkii TaxID=1420899 RepID=A0A3B0BBV3_9ACTN|nr:XRE family transcriptional regulator [Streptomyces klenkii]